MENVKTLLRQLPQVDEIIKSGRFDHIPRQIALKAIRQTIDRIRNEILNGKLKDISKDKILQDALLLASEMEKPSLRKVINATGIVIHTNIGRAPLASEALMAVIETAGGYCNLELDLSTGKRGKRYDHLRGLLRDLTGCEDAVVVNNNAAAVLLCLSALAKGKEVIVSRGELVEIGGAFRIPDVMAQSGAILKEVGTTNKTHLRDYENAITDETALLLKVHRSNYRIIGFTEEVSIEDLVTLGRARALPVMFDLGSGCLFDLRPYGIQDEPLVQEIIAKGTDIVTFSGDKLLGGPQAGIILGRKELIDRIAKHPLTRAVRIDKMTLAALEATLRVYLEPEKVKDRIPVLGNLLQPPEDLKKRANKLVRSLRGQYPEGIKIRVEEDTTRAGGGSLPEVPFPTYVVSISGISSQALHDAMRRADPPVLGRIKEDRFILDMRTVSDSEVPILKEALIRAIEEMF